MSNDLTSNPYDRTNDLTRNMIWEMLVARDAEAFAAIDWSMCAADFAADRFEGISANGALNPCHWTLQYPTVESYRDDWLRMAREFSTIPLLHTSHRELLYRMQAIARVELAGDRAIVWKHFCADEQLKTGDNYGAHSQSVYRLHRINDRWMIVGFVGYLPLD